MTARLLVGLFGLALAACVDEAAPKDAEQAAAAIEQDAVEDSIRKDQFSIEEAAEKATKLIEEDAKAETDAAVVADSKADQ